MSKVFRMLLYRLRISTLYEFYYRITRSIYYLFTDWGLFLHLFHYSSRFFLEYFVSTRLSNWIFAYFYRLNSAKYIRILVEKGYPEYSQFYSIYNMEQLLVMPCEVRKEMMIMFNLNQYYKIGYMKFDIVSNEIYDNSIFISLFYEIRDLIIPLITGTENEYNKLKIGEGTYTNATVDVLPGDIVIDAGANFGVFSVFSSSKMAKVFAFEPIHQTYELLESNIILNSSNVTPIKSALGNFNGEITMKYDADNLGASSIYFNDLKKEVDDNQISISITSLDSFVRNNDIRRIDFIKADIEGYERELLLGAKETIKAFEPKISVCTYHRFDDPVVLSNIIKKISPNYKIVYLSKKIYAYVE